MQQGDAAACDSRTPRHTRATAAAADSDHQFDVEQVRELLDTAARRHRKISDHLVEFGDDSNARQYPVKDARKYDYPLTPVTRPSTAAASLARRGFVSINSGISDAEDSSLVSSSSDTATTSWRDHLQLHVVHLLQKLRAHPVQLRNFLLIQYEDEEEESARRRISVDLGGNDNVDDEDSGEDDGDHAQGDRSAMDENERRARRNRVHKKRMGKNYAKVRLVFKYLHRVAVLMGEQLYHKVHRMLRRSVAHGMLNRQANLVRLDSIYKLELRRQLTVEKLLEAVRLKDAEQKRKRRRQKRDEQHVRKQMQRRKSRMSVAHGGNDGAIETKTPPPNANDAANATDYSNLYSLWEQSIEHNPITSAHFFKMHALERVLAVERQNRDVSFGSSFRLSLDGRLQNSAGELPQRLVSEQTEDLIHEKLTAFLYNKNKDTFPVWKEPPESSFTREETLRHLKRLLPLLMNMPLFHGLSIDQLIEFVRVTQWKAYTHGQKVVQQDTSMDELILIMEGSVDVLSPIGDTGFDYSGIKVEADAANDDTGETDDEDDANFIAPKAGSHLTVKGTPVYFGELGMLSKTEIWTLTLLVKTRTAKILVIPRLAFDLVLQKLFGNSKSRQLLLVAQQRPSSSPTANARTPMLVSPTRPSTAAAIQARDKHLAASRQLQETAVHQKKLRDEQQRAEAEAKNSVERSNGVIGANHNNVDNSRHGAEEGVQVKARQLGRTIQHYPSFETPSKDTTGATGAGHMFRLKWAQPIAFQMQSIDDSVYKEWAPSFPDTSAMVDFLSSSSLSLTCLLFEKKNVLLKANLRSVCFLHPFLESSYVTRDHSQADQGGGTPSDDMFTSDHSSPFVSSMHDTRCSTFGGGTLATMAQLDVGGADNMTLAQFSEARRKTNGRGSSRRHLSSSSSMQHLLSSSTPTSPINSATAMNLGQVAFSRSSFVAESSFLVDRKGNQKQMEILSPNAESGEDESSNDSGFEGALRSPETQRQHGRNQKKANSTAASHSPKDEQVNVPLNPNTKARKMALDSLMYSMSANSQRNSKLLDQDTAKEIIVKKYLEASNPRTGSPSHAKGFQTDKKTSLLQGLPEPNRINTGLHNSHAPLPLRVDLQRRMEVVLGALKMRPKAKLDLVLKYTHADHYDSFQVAVVLWEQALHYITKREVAMASLRKFELVASDPRRHFRSLSTHRLKEQKERDALFYQLNYTSDVCREALTELEKQCGDKVYYEDRLYADKMKKDYTELLFEVEQERLRLIYNGVHPSVSSDDTIDGREPSSHRPFTAYDQSAPSPALSTRRKSYDSSISGGSTLQPNNNDVDKNAHDEPFILSGATTSSGVRHRLSNPQESIFVSIGERKHLDEQKVAQEKQRQETLRVTQEEQERRRKSSHVATHRMAMQVKLHRQVELDELTQRLQTQQSKEAQRPETRRSNHCQEVGSTQQELRSATTTVAREQKTSTASSDLALLQRALHHFIHRPNE